MRDLEPYLRGEQSGKVVGITFDDGYQNNVKNALPVLQKQGFTATCYGVSSMIGGTNLWDHGKVAQKQLMNLQDWHTWIAAGMDVGSHTQTHSDLTLLDEPSARQQIQRSKLDLEHSLGCEVRHFCYPYGHYREEHVTMTKAAGYITATTTRRGRSSAGDDPFALRRVLVARATNPFTFCMKVTTQYEDKRG